MIDQQIDSPILLDFVVKNGSMMLSRSFGSIPVPESSTGNKQMTCFIDLGLYSKNAVTIRHTVHCVNGVRNQIHDNLLQLNCRLAGTGGSSSASSARTDTR